MLAKAQEYIVSAHDYIGEDGKWHVNLPKAAGLALHLGVNRSTLYEWAKVHPEFSNILERINATQEDRVINKAIEGTYNSNIAKLLLGKHGYKESFDHTSDGEKITSINVSVVHGTKATDDDGLGEELPQSKKNNR